MGRLERISSKKPLDWDVEKDGAKEMHWKSGKKDEYDSYEFLYEAERKKDELEDVRKLIASMEAESNDFLRESNELFSANDLGEYTKNTPIQEKKAEEIESKNRDFDKTQMEEDYQLTQEECAETLKRIEDLFGTKIDSIVKLMELDR